MAPRAPLRLVEFRDGPLDDHTHLVPAHGPEDGALEVVVDVDGVRTCLYEWADVRGAGGVVYVFKGFREG